MAQAEPDSVPVVDDEDDNNDNDDDEAFEDAYELPPMSENMDLDSAIADTMTALNLFLNNKFEEAKRRMEPWADRSFYHALGYGTILYIQAVMTFDSADIERAVAATKRSIAVCNKFRRKSTLLSKVNYNKLTREEIHAEICYAECLIERALLMFVQDESLISFVKGALKIRACYQSYKECLRILQKRNWKPDDNKIHFESGVKLGVGLFNLMIALLPTKVMKLLEFVGFSGKKKKGLRLLEEGTEMPTSLRGALCSLSLLSYQTVIVYVLGNADADVELVDKVLKPCLVRYPKSLAIQYLECKDKDLEIYLLHIDTYIPLVTPYPVHVFISQGALFLFFAGKAEEIKSNIPQAIHRFEESIDAQSEWRQFHHLNFWELMWCHSFSGDWLLAMKYAEKLCKESRWSKATYTYQKAAFLMMCDDQTEETKVHINMLFKEVPKLKLRIAGKSIPFEKFAMKKAKRYLDQGNRLILPAYELIYVWNGFAVIGKNPKYLQPILDDVESVLKELEANKTKYPFYTDDYCLVMLLKGTCLRYLGKLTEAEQCLLHLCTNEKDVKQDTYLIPYSLVELGMLNIEKGDLNAASSFLDMAKRYQKYSLESRLLFRIHAAKLELQYATGMKEEDSSIDELTPPETPTNSNDQIVVRL
ncbi:hypothetical protein LSH36_62g07003 [Paralvinella palmiformis]|uniref:Tetratricopeptide repeat protein 39B n=1 Tax=Paralvinella palmiformis TaxID=53620 RepID=A0AAD9K421_9ANNE|nr:hypothetical protein LSH36_62g07003 [Paralvinella palmiformis]